MHCITRNPSELLRKQGQKAGISFFPAPMNNSGQHHSGEQPVQYTNVALSMELGHFRKGTIVERASVHWRTGEVQIWSGNAFFSGLVQCAGKQQYSNMFYVREVIEFLARGHSLLEAECRCEHKKDTQRACELGISRNKQNRNGHFDPESWRDGNCTLCTQRRACTAEEVAQEIAVTNLYLVVDSAGRLLVDDLVASTHIVLLPREKQSLFAYKPTHDNVTCKQELLHLIENSPLGIRQPLPKQMYNEVTKDVEALALEKNIFRIYNPETKQHMCFPRMKHLELPLDQDLKTLWASHPPAKHQDIAQQLVNAGLEPAKQQERVPFTGAKRRLKPRSSKRSLQKTKQ